MASAPLASITYACSVPIELAEMIAAALQRPESTTLAVTDQPVSCAERGIVLLFAGISYNNGICVPKKQHVYQCALSSERLSSDPSSC